MAKTYGIAWCDGRDPEDGGWHFDGGGTVDGYDIAYEVKNRQDALDQGVTATILDMYEQDGHTYLCECNLFLWLQEHSDLFRS